MKTKSFIQLICILAVCASVAVYRIAPPAQDYSAGTVGTLALLALTAELMGFLLPRGAAGSISFIPYMTALMLAPNFSALVAVGGANAIAEIAKRRGGLKVLFNSAQLVVSYGLAILIYRALGGQSLFDLKHLPIAQITLIIGLPVTVAYAIV